MVKRIFIVLFFLFTVTINFAQNFEDFKDLSSSGEIPEDFLKLSTDKTVEAFKKNKNKKLDREFYVDTRFFIDELLLSGKVVFNDPISTYIKEVARYVLKNKQEIFNKLRFYTIKSTAVNAFSTDQGIIFITTGLMAQLENEAQLAFILAHEISHFTESHVQGSYIKRAQVKEMLGRYGRSAYQKAIGELSVYSKENELKADEIGIELFNHTDYDINQITTTFQVLLYAQLPFEDRALDHKFLDTEFLNIPDSLFPSEINPISIVSNYSDKWHSHPNIDTRIYKAEKITNGRKFGDKAFIISESKFDLCRKMARYQSVNLRLNARQYDKALYEIYLLQIKDSNRFLDLSKVKALYGIAKYKNASRFSEVVDPFLTIEGESSSLNYLLYRLTKNEINIIAYRHLYDAVIEHPADPVFKSYFESFQKDFLLKGKFPIEDLRMDSFDPNKDEFYLYALRDIYNDSIQLAALQTLKKAYDEETPLYSFYKYEENKRGLNLDKVVVVDPDFFNYGTKMKKKHEKSESKKIMLVELFAADYDKLNLERVSLSTKDLDSSNAESLNDIYTIFAWMEEVLYHEGMDFITSYSEDMKEIAKKYGTPNFLFSGFYSFKMRNTLGESLISYLLITTVYLAPLALLDVVFPHAYFQLVAFEMNVETNQLEFVHRNTVNFNDNTKVLRHYVFNILDQISNKGE